IFAVLQPLSGDHSAKNVAQRQPEKLAAMEGLFHTEKSAGLTVGGIPDVKNQEMKLGIKIPGLLSFLAYGDFNAEVKGLNEFPRENWPPVLPVHISFQIMVACGFFLAAVGVVFWLLRWKWKKYLFDKKFLYLAAVSTPLGFLAVEAGWTVTEVGRQPWIIYNIMKTADSVTPVPGQILHLSVFILIYLILTVVAVWLMRRQIRALHASQPQEGSTEA
ncbi:MAG TPA: cytochrome ubiquinol oxidase subunit I, partial [Ignavibacteriaceae bacterium]|nr:cytochrome ubiquinol oxidase subunit I [Ignavibacteriaceae bacterium]